MDWLEAARRLESGIEFPRIPRRVRERLDDADPIFVACSGGADSVFATLVVYLYLRRSGREACLRVLHFDHALRGEASAGDAEFSRAMSDGFGLPFFVAQAEWAKGLSRVTEAMAREARLRFFREATGSVNGAGVSIVTGHHADDVAESMLMRLSRGAGLQGLTAPREISDAGSGIQFLRPILGFSRDEIRGLLTKAGIDWREDATNESDANYRARLRGSVMPAWDAAADRPVRVGVSRSRGLLAEDAEALEIWSERAWVDAWREEEGGLDRVTLVALPVALRRRLLQRLLEVDGLTANLAEAALAALEEEGRCEKIEVRFGVFLFIEEVLLRRVELLVGAVGRDWSTFRLPVGAVAFLPDGARLELGRVSDACGVLRTFMAVGNDDGKSAYLSELGNTCDAVTVRRRRAGDAFKPLGKSSAKKLKTLFIDRKIDREERDRLPVFVWEGAGIVWVPGLPPSGDCQLSDSNTSALRLTYER